MGEGIDNAQSCPPTIARVFSYYSREFCTHEAGCSLELLLQLGRNQTEGSHNKEVQSGNPPNPRLTAATPVIQLPLYTRWKPETLAGLRFSVLESIA